MDKAIYLRELERELSGLSSVDRQNALAYYNEFLEDAEAEGQTDPSVLLGSPHTLAAQVKAEIAMGTLGGGNTAETTPNVPDRETVEAVSGTGAAGADPFAEAATPGSFAGATASDPFADAAPAASPWSAATPEPGVGVSPDVPPTPPPAQPVAPGAPSQSGTKSGLEAIWIVILAIFAIPIGVPLAVALVAVIFSLLVALAALLVSFGIVAVAFLAAGILACVVGFFFLFSEFPVGLFYMGAGLMILGLCILVAMGCRELAKLCVRGVALAINAIRKKLTKREGIAS
jgi:uncharacterized membrane protein